MLIGVETDHALGETPFPEGPDGVDAKGIQVRSEAHVVSGLGPDADSIPVEVLRSSGNDRFFGDRFSNFYRRRNHKLTGRASIDFDR